MLQIDFFCCRPSREIESRKLNLGKKWEIQVFSKLSEFSTICKIYYFLQITTITTLRGEVAEVDARITGPAMLAM